MFDVTIHTHLFLEQNILLLIHYVVSCQSLDVIFYTHVYGTILFLPMHCILSQFIHSFMAQYSFCRYIMSYLINSLRSNFIQLMAQCHFCKYINFCHILPTVRDFIHILQQIYSISADTFCQVLSIFVCQFFHVSLVNCLMSHFIHIVMAQYNLLIHNNFIIVSCQLFNVTFHKHIYGTIISADTPYCILSKV